LSVGEALRKEEIHEHFDAAFGAFGGGFYVSGEGKMKALTKRGAKVAKRPGFFDRWKELDESLWPGRWGDEEGTPCLGPSDFRKGASTYIRTGLVGRQNPGTGTARKNWWTRVAVALAKPVSESMGTHEQGGATLVWKSRRARCSQRKFGRNLERGI
jgi:hypothetical protein